ncbi:MAG TPA: C25 family cysteine peptidase [Pyrinomonadaceae bacterium]
MTFKRPQTTKQRYISDITMDGFQAETFAGANKLTWKTSHEKNVLGFKIWRDDQGERVLVNEETISGSLLRVADGVLQTGYEYSFYDLTDSTNVYYWLEAINGNSQSRMFGPIYPQGNFDPEAIERESETIAELRSSRNRRAAQTETVDFTEPVTETENFSSPLRLGKGEIQTTESAAQDSLLTNDPNALKIEVRGRGLFRVDAQNLASNGFSASQSTNWKLFSGGVEQPMIVNGDGSIEFYGQGIDTVQTDANVYWLMTDTSAGKRIKRVSQKFLSSAKNTATRVTVEKRDRINRASSILNGGRENWFGALIGPSAANQTLLLSDIADESRQTATVSIDLQGLTAIPHQVSVLLNGVSLGQIGFMYYDRKEWSTTVPLTRLVEGANTITMQTLGGSQDFTLTESIRISYPRDLRAQNNRLDFSVPGGQAAKLSGFASSEVRMLDVTNPLAISELAPQSRQEADGTYSVTINSASNARLLTAFGTTTGAQAVASVQRNNPSDLKNLSNQGKFLVVAPVEYKELLRPLCDARTASGIRTQFVDVEDIYDEFSGGVKSAEAIRSFLQYAKQNWAVKPDYVMFVGDASVDPRNYSGMGGYVNNRVPTMFTDTWNMETVSDEMMVDFNGDSVGELAVGRLPAKNENELGAMLEKIMNTRPLTRQEINTRGVHFISDTFYDYNFMNGSRTMASSFPSTIAVNYSDFSGADAAGFRANIVSRINSNPAIVNYFGHASVSSWSNAQIFRSGDVSSLTNSQSAPFMALINCLNGDYAETNLLSVAEAMMKRRSGGASAVWAASGYNGAFEQEYMTRDFYQKVFTGMPLGEAARQTKALYPTTDLRRTYVFFGDPTQSLVIQ